MGTTQKLILVTLKFKKFENFLKIHESVLPQNPFFQLTDNTATTVFMLAWKIRVVDLHNRYSIKNIVFNSEF